MTRRRSHAAFALAAFALAIAACSSGGEQADTSSAPASQVPKDAIRKIDESGPVKAETIVWPKAPKLGDPIHLRLEVEADPGVELRMPAFGDALGRFDILEFTPRQKSRADGGTSASQEYVLDTPMSGKQTIPSLLVEFADKRPGHDKDKEREKELLTDEISIDVQSVLPEGADRTLRPARGELPLERSRSALSWPVILLCAAALLVLAAVLLLFLRRRRDRRARISAFDLARRRLAALEARGIPEGDDADEWYVELSSIVRRYLEGRYALRAPELTTEEFLRVAGRSAHLRREHRALLASFLEQCDRVKFAGYRPGDEESRAVLESARRFLVETRASEEADRDEQQEEAA